MSIALLTGEAMETAEVTAGFERHGFEVHVAAPWGSNRLPAGGIDCYVQLPGGTVPAAPALGRNGLVGRLDLLALMARRLSPTATVILAVDDSEPSQTGGSNDLLAALAMVVLEEAGREKVRVVVLPATEVSRHDEVVIPDAVPVVAYSA